jgi:hypothetical protein
MPAQTARKVPPVLLDRKVLPAHKDQKVQPVRWGRPG